MRSPSGKPKLRVVTEGERIPKGSIGFTTGGSFYTWTIQEAEIILSVLQEWDAKRVRAAGQPTPDPTPEIA